MTAPLPDTPRIEMWFDFASPYSYLAIERIDALAQEAAVRVDLRPFLLGPIFQAQGWNDTPFRLFPGKGAYMMRDIARLAEKYEIPVVQTVAIGDGANDLPMIKAAGLGIAYHAKPKVNEKTEVTIRHADLMGVFCILSGSLNQK